MAKTKLKHKQYLIDSVVEGDRVAILINLNHLKGKIYRVSFEELTDTSNKFKWPLVDRYVTRGKIAELIRIKQFKFATSVEIAAVLLSV